LSSERRIVRAPNHLGDVVLALPAIYADGSDVLVVRWLAPILEMAGVRGEIVPFDRGLGGFARAVRELRRRGYRQGTLMTPAFSAAWLLSWGGVGELRGTATDGRGLLLSDRIARDALSGRHRTDGYKILMGQDTSDPPESHPVESHPVVPPADRVEEWRVRLESVLAGSRLVAVFPGANAPARRWPVERFGEAARAIGAEGAGVVVLGGEQERGLTAVVAAATPDAVDLGGETDLTDLAAILSLCDLVLTNDTGPMHLAGAVGAPTVSLWGSSDPGEVRQAGAADTRVTGAALPCKPCYRNHCRRRGRGTLLADAHEECMRLITVADVVGAVRDARGGGHGDE
jgi:heptosyltransferase-2